MNNKIKIYKIDSSIEEAAECLVNEQRFVGFIAYASKEIEVGKEYDAEIDIFVNDGLYIEEQKGTKLKGLEHIENFSYILNGKLLDDDILDVGFIVTSDLFEDYRYLKGEYVTLKADRVQISID
ncbi:hypothetical protein [Carnobacterium maltaromaticum]|uniref:hypothetical protein n=1 Tax=Carnobacterium maltaromaticum TaxID=2751 RepID=UPI00295E95CC|nr:hypothetical protein [Carnobacterium maltaromaticum]